MESLQITPSVIASTLLFILGLGGTVFTIYNHFRDPDIKADKTDALLTLEIQNIKTSLANLKDNHIHSLELAQLNTNQSIKSLEISVAKLQTIIDERIPRSA